MDGTARPRPAAPTWSAVQKHPENSEVSYELIMHVANAITGIVLRERDSTHSVRRKSVVRRLFDSIDVLRATSKSARKITDLAVRLALARVMRVALPRTIDTDTIVICMEKDPELATSLVRQARLSPLSAEASNAILSRLVDYSKAAKAARKEIEAIKNAAQADADRAALARIESLIESARDVLAESLARATVVAPHGTENMYPNPRALADTVIERLRGRGNYEPLPIDALRTSVGEFTGADAAARASLIEKHGPLCLWDVSAHTSLDDACSAGFGSAGFSSDLFWDTRAARTMACMFRNNLQFKGYIGTWDVSKVENANGMFAGAGIEDSGIGSWNTEGLSAAMLMFHRAPNLSKALDLSRWTFGPNPKMHSMFQESGIVDCKIGAWNVTNANTYKMLNGATKFTGLGSLQPPNWPKEKRDAAEVPELNPKFGASDRSLREEAQAAASSTKTSATGRTTASDRDIANVLESATRALTLQRREQKTDGAQCVIL